MSRPLRDHRIAWDFPSHVEAGKRGGDDLLTFQGERIEAPVTGRLTMSGSTASIRQADSWRTVLLELGGLVGARSRDVVEGEIIATAGRLWVHAHELAPGDPATKHTRARWLPDLDPAGETGTPITPDETQESDMLILRTPQHGIYTVSPGCVVSHIDTTVAAGLDYRGKAQVMDLAPEDLAKFIFATSGCPATQIPAPGYAWSITAGLTQAGGDDAAVLAALDQLSAQVAAGNAAVNANIDAVPAEVITEQKKPGN